MAKLVWDKTGERFYETGVKNGVLYVADGNGGYEPGVAWNGLTSVSESPEGAESNAIYADDMKYLDLTSIENFNGTIGAYYYPPEFAECNGEAELVAGVMLGQQDRKSFAFCYRTALGNDTAQNNHGYKLHIVYGAKASVSSREYATINDSPEPIEFSWDFTTTPVEVEGFKPTALVVIDSTKVDAEKLAALEASLYGDTDSEPTLLLPNEIKTMLTSA